MHESDRSFQCQLCSHDREFNVMVAFRGREKTKISVGSYHQVIGFISDLYYVWPLYIAFFSIFTRYIYNQHATIWEVMIGMSSKYKLWMCEHFQSSSSCAYNCTFAFICTPPHFWHPIIAEISCPLLHQKTKSYKQFQNHEKSKS
jgi:hypothetical protein